MDKIHVERVDQAQENPNRLPAAERYLRDSQFAMLVDVLIGCLVNAEYTPTELREAVIFAATRYEMEHARPTFVVRGDEEAVERFRIRHTNK